MKIPRRLFSKSTVGALLFVLAFAYFYWIAGGTLAIAGDEGIYLEGGRRVAMGEWPYRDFFVLTGPLTFWIEGLLARASGLNLPLMRLPLILDAAFLAWAVYWLLARYTSALFAAGASFVFAVYESRQRLLNVNHRWDSGALGTAAVLAAFVGRTSGASWLWMAAGVLAGLAAWATPSVGLVFIPVLLSAARQRLRSALAVIAGGAAASGVALLYLHTGSALSAMIESFRWTGMNYGLANRLPYGSVWAGATPDIALWQYLFITVQEVLPAVLPIAAVVLWIWRSRGFSDQRPDKDEVILLLTATIALTLAAWPRWTSDTLLHTMALPWCLCALWLYRVIEAKPRLWWSTAVVAITVAAFAAKIAEPLRALPVETRVGALRDPGGDGEILGVLEKWVQPGDSLFSFPYLPSAYFLLTARNPSRYSFLQPGMMTSQDEQNTLSDLRRDPPKWVIYEKFPAEAVLKIWPGSDPARIPMTALNSYLATNYQQVEEIASPHGRLFVMRRVIP